MAILSRNMRWFVTNGNSWQRKVFRGGAKRMEIKAINDGANAASYFVQEINIPEFRYLLDLSTFAGGGGEPASVPGALGLAFPISEAAGSTSLANAGSVGGTGTVQTGAVSAAQTPVAGEYNTTVNGMSNGYFLARAAGYIAASSAPWLYCCWYYPTLISALSPLYQENNGGVTHYLQLYVDTDRRLGVTGNNGGGVKTYKDAAGPQVALNGWNFCVWLYDGTNVYTWVSAPLATVPARSAATAGTGMPFFADGAATYMGILSGSNGFVSYPAAMVTQPTFSTAMAGTLVNDMIQAQEIVQMDSGSLASQAALALSYGSGTGKPLPNTVVFGFSGASEAYGGVTVTMRDDL